MSCPLQKYKDMFGQPNTGAHQYRFLDTAIVDYMLTIVGACLTTHYTKIPLPLTTIVLFILSIVMHMLFGVETNTLKYLNIKCT